MDGRQRVSRLRPRPLDWVVDEARPRWRRRAEISPTVPGGSRSLREWLLSFWSPSLRVLEVSNAGSQLATEATVHRASEYCCLAPRGVSAKSEEVGRLGWTLLHGEPAALTRCRLKFDFIVWLREETSLAAIFNAAEPLLSPDGLLAVRTTKRFDTRLGRGWHVAGVVALSDGMKGIAARRRSRAKAA